VASLEGSMTKMSDMDTYTIRYIVELGENLTLRPIPYGDGADAGFRIDVIMRYRCNHALSAYRL